jgi:hypothetical protein
MTRRNFLSLTAATAAVKLFPIPGIAAPDGPKRIAVVTTIYRYLSHAQHIADRFMVGYPYGGDWHKPDMKIVSLYTDQRPEGDQSEARAREFGFKVYPTMRSQCLWPAGGGRGVSVQSSSSRRLLGR